MSGPCPFCAISAGQEPASIVHDDEQCLAFLSPVGISPDGHFWIVEYRLKVYASRKHFEITDRIPDPFAAS